MRKKCQIISEKKEIRARCLTIIIEGEKMRNEIIIFEDTNIKLEVSLKNETVWLTQSQMADLFKKGRSTITEHINNIFEEGELDEKSNVGFSDIANSDKPVKIYNLDVIISVGYLIKSKRGIAFRIWANKILKEYLLNGKAINQQRIEYLEKIKTIKITIDK